VDQRVLLTTLGLDPIIAAPAPTGTSATPACETFYGGYFHGFDAHTSETAHNPAFTWPITAT
jgi:hypothetical protein